MCREGDQKQACYRLYGTGPCKRILIHGGPGAQGTLVPVAERVAERASVLEHLQRGYSVDELVSGISGLIDERCDGPVYMAGHSWGAWLALIFAAAVPHMVKKLVLIGCGPLEQKYAPAVERNRRLRLAEDEIRELDSLSVRISMPGNDDRRRAFLRFAEIMERTDSYRLVPERNSYAEVDYESYEKLWPEAEYMRRSGRLLSLACSVRCPVTAIHGSHDPHPAEGVEILSSCIDDFRFVMLERCGHSPWLEAEAAEKFYEVLGREMDL